MIAKNFQKFKSRKYRRQKVQSRERGGQKNFETEPRAASPLKTASRNLRTRRLKTSSKNSERSDVISRPLLKTELQKISIIFVSFMIALAALSFLKNWTSAFEKIIVLLFRWLRLT